MARQLIIPEPFRVAYREVEVPPPGAGQIKCRTVLTGISHGTEMTAYTGSSPFIARTFDNRLFRDKRAGDGDFYPFLWAGYDAVGVVSEIGRGVTRYKVGDRVWSNQRHQTEFLFDESFDETIVLSDRVRNEHAIMLNLTSIALTAINDAEIKLGDVVAIVGGGVVGPRVRVGCFWSSRWKAAARSPPANARPRASTRPRARRRSRSATPTPGNGRTSPSNARGRSRGW
jgi:threonine dehydrogenase-like Zn-dependent dehydrogenase